ncbi:pseudaminic acid cytidylyltransferase [Roseovarius sp. EGI FJ00037]|uniref:pseudaminic acid cytidylyltransferase n=1 Tax=Roseovarius TaxID=74030 RepID=UPI0022A6BE5C|nr:pseudaminic acid cytidylyltransferase [Roseovarius sp. EGI FJ00037]MCZ0811376.1 pseudaminic acid cytidylyltransferase [Roseovarius sp. EGI FJ00037]
MAIAVIPARAGSKRVPQKNIADICGRPMIAWTISNALTSNAFDEVVVSTDCPSIAGIAKAAGADVPGLRPPDLSDDHTPLDVVMRNFAQTTDQRHDWICMIYATALLLEPATLARAADLAGQAAQGEDFVMSLLPFPHPPQRAVALEGGIVRMIAPEHARTRTQDLPPRLHDAAQFVFGRRQAWLDGKTVWNSRTRGIALSPAEAIDIDLPADIDIARALMAGRIASQESPS